MTILQRIFSAPSLHPHVAVSCCDPTSSAPSAQHRRVFSLPSAPLYHSIGVLFWPRHFARALFAFRVRCSEAMSPYATGRRPFRETVVAQHDVTMPHRARACSLLPPPHILHLLSVNCILCMRQARWNDKAAKPTTCGQSSFFGSTAAKTKLCVVLVGAPSTQIEPATVAMTKSILGLEFNLLCFCLQGTA